MNAFTTAYIECALWSSTDNADDRGGEPLDKNYSVSDISAETLARMEADCAAFETENATSLAVAAAYIDAGKAGFFFWLTRNGHGAGFWDGDLPDALGEDLTAASKRAGEIDLYIGDDGQVWQSPL